MQSDAIFLEPYLTRHVSTPLMNSPRVYKRGYKDGCSDGDAQSYRDGFELGLIRLFNMGERVGAIEEGISAISAYIDDASTAIQERYDG